jgi:hypothetical protein
MERIYKVLNIMVENRIKIKWFYFVVIEPGCQRLAASQFNKFPFPFWRFR